MKKHEVSEKPDAYTQSRTRRPTSAEQVGRFTERLQIVTKGRSARSFARSSGISESGFRKYLAGKSEPTRPALIAIASEAGVTIDWLAAGEGPMRAAKDESQPVRLDRKTLVEAIEIVERALALACRKATVAQRAVLIAMAYEIVLEESSISAALKRIIANLQGQEDESTE